LECIFEAGKMLPFISGSVPLTNICKRKSIVDKDFPAGYLTDCQPVIK
jgi:hypothetical protein